MMKKKSIQENKTRIEKLSEMTKYFDICYWRNRRNGVESPEDDECINNPWSGI
ncbi:MAG: hypothetical protein ACXAEU_01650 [Candidatus Hodarchaeales archaeon]|jgi:hypothetical protein